MVQYWTHSEKKYIQKHSIATTKIITQNVDCLTKIVTETKSFEMVSLFRISKDEIRFYLLEGGVLWYATHTSLGYKNRYETNLVTDGNMSHYEWSFIMYTFWIKFWQKTKGEWKYFIYIHSSSINFKIQYLIL